MKRPKVVIVLTSGKITSAYLSLELLGRVDVMVVDYDQEGLKSTLRTELIEVEIKEGFLVETELTSE